MIRSFGARPGCIALRHLPVLLSLPRDSQGEPGGCCREGGARGEGAVYHCESTESAQSESIVYSAAMNLPWEPLVACTMRTAQAAATRALHTPERCVRFHGVCSARTAGDGADGGVARTQTRWAGNPPMYCVAACDVVLLTYQLAGTDVELPSSAGGRASAPCMHGLLRCGYGAPVVLQAACKPR